jgi:MerR family transcriptional regulator, light-induced transcriptional regulator
MTSSRRSAAPRTAWDVNDVPARDAAAAKPRILPMPTAQRQPEIRLVRAIEQEIIPRLILSHRGASRTSSSSAADGAVPGPAEVLKFASLVLTADVAAAQTYVAALRERGTPVETLYLDLLAPAARHLGELWCADACDFSTVTVGLGRLQQVMHELSPAFAGELEHREHGRRALLVPVPGEQHTFGLLMVVEFFRRAGWDVWSGSRGTSYDLVRLVRSEWFAVVGLSVGSETRIDALATGIRAIRRASVNRDIGILVGGPIFIAHPELVARVGADATAMDGGQAALQAENLLTLLPHRH